MEQLRKSKYVLSVSSSTVRFSEDFKRLFYQRMHSGEKAKAIFRDCGIDPDILGYYRVKNFSYVLNKAAKREEGFVDKRQNNYRRPPGSNAAALPRLASGAKPRIKVSQVYLE